MDQPQILYEDTDILAINKPPGLLVHPLEKNSQPSLIDWLIEQGGIDKSLAWPDPARPGIVHRLDRDTSGVLLIAKTPEMLEILQKQFAERVIEKVYLSLAYGNPDWRAYHLRAPVQRDKGTRRKASFLALSQDQSKMAETDFAVRESFMAPGVALIEARPKTGRTNQIRVHLELLGYPILGDPWYQTKTSRRRSQQLNITRLMLHAYSLRLHHPKTGADLALTAPIPNDMDQVLKLLRNQ